MDGRNECAQFGWPAVAEPTECWKNAVVLSSSASGTVGTATKFATVTRNGAPLASGWRGVITSSSPSRRQVRGRPLTETPPTDWPAKSRSKRESACVARASSVTVPCIGDDGALVG